jgi:4-alpha-glucanotransferase
MRVPLRLMRLGLASCSLALLPVEDALATPDQPNLPGTIDEHPNWRRRLPISAQDILNQPDVANRLAALNQARSR